VPASVVAPSGRLRAIRFRGGSLKRTIGLASRQDRPFTPAADAFVTALKEHMSER
jgi:DNA-binding transcriptional LysR family regulator